VITTTTKNISVAQSYLGTWSSWYRVDWSEFFYWEKKKCF